MSKYQQLYFLTLNDKMGKLIDNEHNISYYVHPYLHLTKHISNFLEEDIVSLIRNEYFEYRVLDAALESEIDEYLISTFN